MESNDFIIYEEEFGVINEVLQRLIKECEAKCALLVDKDGHLITRQGFTKSLDTTALAALLAGSFASTKEIARLVGEPEFSVLFHQGKRDHVHVLLVGERSILAVIFDDRTTIGMVRLYSKEAGNELEEIFQRAPIPKAGEMPKYHGVDSDFTDVVEDRLDEMFSG